MSRVAADTFHLHLDACPQCRNHPMALCPDGHRLLEWVGGQVNPDWPCCATCDRPLPGPASWAVEHTLWKEHPIFGWRCAHCQKNESSPDGKRTDQDIYSSVWPQCATCDARIPESTRRPGWPLLRDELIARGWGQDPDSGSLFCPGCIADLVKCLSDERRYDREF